MSTLRNLSPQIAGERKIALELGGYDIEVSAFVSAAQSFYHLLVDLDITIAGKRTLIWNLSDLGLGSAILEATPKPMDEEEEDISAPLISAAVSGLREIERGATRPAYFSDQALDELNRLVETLRDGVSRVSVVATVGQERETVSLTQRVAANVSELIGVARVSLGSVEGALEMISVHGGAFFNVYEFIHHKRVRCDFPKEFLEMVKDALGKRVLVYGEVKSNPQGQPISVKVHKLRIFKDQAELPKVEDIVGLDRDFTGGTESGEYPRRLWSGEG